MSKRAALFIFAGTLAASLIGYWIYRNQKTKLNDQKTGIDNILQQIREKYKRAEEVIFRFWKRNTQSSKAEMTTETRGSRTSGRTEVKDDSYTGRGYTGYV